MSQQVRELMAAFGQVAQGQDHDTVVEAAANLILNGLRQKHPKLEGAEAQLDALVREMRDRLGKDHYDHNGYRREQRIVIPPLGALVRA